MNLPNWLSLFRLALVPAFFAVYFSEMEYANIVAVIIYGVACLTDVLDGKIARKYNKITKLGRILDPMADKAMTFSVLLCITVDRIIPIWALIIFVMKELLMLIGGMILLKKSSDMPPSNYFGKISTAVFFFVCVYLMLFLNTPKLVAAIMIAVATACSLTALVSYFIRYLRMMRNFGNAKPSKE